MLLFLTIYLFLPFLNGALTDYKSYNNHKIYEIEGNHVKIGKLLKHLSQYNEIIYNYNHRSKAEVLIEPELVEIFLSAAKHFNLQRKLVVEDFSKIIEREKQAYYRTKSAFSWNAYYDVDEIYSFLKNTSLTYPDQATLIVGGQSYEGRQILGLRINTPTKTNKQVVFIESGIHAREWIAPATTTYFINQLLTSSDSSITSLRDKFDWHIFPTVNPDGYHYTFVTDRMWRKTRSRSSNGCYGADANRNWDYNWGQNSASSDPCDKEFYEGSKPFSEVETRTLSRYIQDLKNLTAYIGFHADAQMVLIPYSDSEKPVSNFDDLHSNEGRYKEVSKINTTGGIAIGTTCKVRIGNKSIEYGEKVNGVRYSGPQTAANILYKASGGSMDWVRYKMNTPLVYTYELRGNNFHWPPGRIPEQGDEVTQMLLGLFTEACSIGYC